MQLPVGQRAGAGPRSACKRDGPAHSMMTVEDLRRANGVIRESAGLAERIERNEANRDRPPLADPSAGDFPGDRVDHGEEFLRIHRLGEEAVHASFGGALPVLRIDVGRERID